MCTHRIDVSKVNEKNLDKIKNTKVVLCFIEPHSDDSEKRGELKFNEFYR
jgi:hypothetical protein